MSQKSCFIPNCKNTSSNQPNLMFISVPRKMEIRRKWGSVLNIPRIPKSSLYCCEIHFNLKNDLQNWQYFKTFGKRLRLKDGVVPHVNLDGDTGQEGVTKSQLTDSDREEKLDYIAALDRKLSKSNRKDPRPDITLPSLEFDNNSSDDEIGLSASSESNDDKTQNISDVDMQDAYESRAISTLHAIKHHSRLYLGLPREVYEVVDFLCLTGKCIARDVMICLKKIRLNDAYVRLGIDFGLDESTVSQIFVATLGKITPILKETIFWPSRSHIKYSLPIPFRDRYNSVQSIVHCFEIEIQKPTDLIQYSCTWSERRKCNSIQFLISIAPNGFVNYVSEGFGGQASDLYVIQNSGFLSEMPNNITLMSDCNFKGIESILKEYECSLVRAPSLPSDEELSKDQLRVSRVNTAVRMQAERAIKRVRQFAMLQLHANIDINHVNLLNDCVIVGVAIVNLQ